MGRRVPVEPVLGVFGLDAKACFFVRLHRAGSACLRVELIDDAEIAPGIGISRVVRIHSDIGALTAAVHFPVVTANAAIARAAFDRDGGVVLLTAVDTVFKLTVRVDAIELCCGLVILP